MSDTETVSINLDMGGDFTEGAAVRIDSANALSAALVKLEEAGQRVKNPMNGLREEAANAVTSQMNQQVALSARLVAFDAVRTRDMDRQQKLLNKMHDDATGITAANAKRETFDEGATSLAYAGGVVLTAAAAIGAAAWKLEQAGIETTSRHEVQGDVGRELGGDYDRSIRFSLNAGLDPEATWQTTKKLLSEKFSQHDSEEIVHIKAGMDLAGQNGEGFVSALSRIRLESKTSARDVESLKKVGIDARSVYAELAHTMGTDVATATMKVQHGLADSEQVISAIEKVAGGRFGGMADIIAGKVPALVARVKGDFGEMFDFGPGSLDGVKDVLRNVAEVFEGPTGEELKASAREVFGALNHAFLDDFRGEEGKARIADFAHNVAASIHEIAQSIETVKPLIQFVEKMALQSAGDHTSPQGTYLFDSFDQNVKPDAGAPQGSYALDGFDKWASGIFRGADAQQPEAVDTGHQLVSGVAEGVRSGQGEVAGAMADAVRTGMDAAKAEARIHSPSEEAAEEVGGPVAQGMALGMRRDPSPAAAGRQMAADALAGAKGAVMGGASGGGSAGASAGAPVSVEVNVAITVEGGGASAEQDWQRLIPVVQRVLRRDARDAFEAALR